MGYRKPRHGRAITRKPRARSRILKKLPHAPGRNRAREGAEHPDTIEIWFSDEARIGQKNKITRRWAKRGTRPSAPRDQRTASTYIFGAVCPKEGKGAALILPTCNTEAMNLTLEIAAAVAPGAHAVLLVDQAWLAHVRRASSCHPTSPLWRCTEMSRAQSGRKRLAVPARQLAFEPRLQILRRSRRPLLCGMNKLIDQPWRIMSIGLRQWAHGFRSSGTWYKIVPKIPWPGEVAPVPDTCAADEVVVGSSPQDALLSPRLSLLMRAA